MKVLKYILLGAITGLFTVIMSKAMLAFILQVEGDNLADGDFSLLNAFTVFALYTLFILIIGLVLDKIFEKKTPTIQK